MWIRPLCPEYHVLVLDIMETSPLNYYFAYQSDFSRVFSTWHSHASLNTFSASRNRKTLRENLRRLNILQSQ